MELDWLDDLESRVRDTVARLEELKEENRTLRAAVEDLETRAAVATTPPAMFEEREERDADEEVEVLHARVRELEGQVAAAGTERAEAAAAAKAWEIEREEVRRRVAGLVARLEGMAG